MDSIDKYRLLATLVRGVFAAYPAGIIDCHVSDPREKFQPQTVKRLMLDHYGDVNGVFNNAMLVPIAVINFDYEEVSRIIHDACERQMPVMDFFKAICVDDEFYQAFKAEYKRNFNLLLAGRYSSIREHLNDYTRCKGKSKAVDGDTAIRLVVSTVMAAYADGVRGGGTGKVSLHQPTVFRLLADSITALLHDKPLSFSQSDMRSGAGGILLKACRTPHNLEVMMAEMDNTYAELVKHCGIIANDDTAN